MKQKLILFFFSAAFLGVAYAVTRQKPAPIPETQTQEQQFQVRGVIREIDREGMSLLIEHEPIPSFMPAMTMPFALKESSLFDGLAVNDRVEFKFMVTAGDSWIAQIAQAPESGEQAGRSLRTAPPGGGRRLEIGERVPGLKLSNQEGQPISLRDFQGRALLITFIYTRCPIPNFCPLMSKNFASLQERLEKEFPGRFHLLSISFDPEFDTPARLKAYGSAVGANPERWSFATGGAAVVDEVTGLFGVYREPENGTIAHDLRTALISPEGKLVHVWKSNVWTPYEVQRRVREVLTGRED